MKAHKVDEVEFSINHSFEDVKIDMVWKHGCLYLSLSQIYLTDGEVWYEVPVKELENISVIQEQPLRLKFQVPSIDIVVTGERAERLLALRHFLLPYIKFKIDLSDEQNLMKAALKFWVLGMNDLSTLAEILKISQEKVSSLLKIAHEKNYLTAKNKLSRSAQALYSENEIKILRKLGGLDD